MSQAEQRRIALGAARSYLRTVGTPPSSATFAQAWEALDAVYRSDPALIAARWYIASSDAQVAAFKRDWASYVRSAQ